MIRNKKFPLTVFTLITLLIMACQQEPVIHQRPIQWDQEREQLSLEYLKQRHGMDMDKALIDPKMIVIHWTVIPTLEESFQAFNPVRLPSARSGIQSASALNVSAHFLIDRDGTIYQLLPETTFARHVIGLNHCAIGIENVADGDQLPLTEEQYRANLQLVKYLSKKYDLEYLIGHDQYTRFVGHPLWKETDPDYLTHKTDVGEEFIHRLHEELKDTDLKKAPENRKK
ncbi:peptidoglycan recognition family protein [Rapidithrix thailandica]|uniref:N-acetylmuramoyl-L-alanine amidase n=1 Tax=Rapidithrix thailandica TaxID=413964 RepID=A0AAW9S9V6_9BACT